MIDHSLDDGQSILHLRPKGPLAEADFAALTTEVDAHIDRTGGLAGIVIEAPGFPGWESFPAMKAHFRFVRDHHRQIRRLAVVTDSPMGKVAEHLASHFVAAEIRQFPAGQAGAAKQWILGA